MKQNKKPRFVQRFDDVYPSAVYLGLIGLTSRSKRILYRSSVSIRSNEIRLKMMLKKLSVFAGRGTLMSSMCDASDMNSTKPKSACKDCPWSFVVMLTSADELVAAAVVPLFYISVRAESLS